METEDITIFPDSDDERIVTNVRYEYYKTDSFMRYDADEEPGISYLSIHSFDGKLNDREFAELLNVIRQNIEDPN